MSLRHDWSSKRGRCKRNALRKGAVTGALTEFNTGDAQKPQTGLVSDSSKNKFLPARSFYRIDNIVLSQPSDCHPIHLNHEFSMDDMFIPSQDILELYLFSIDWPMLYDKVSSQTHGGSLNHTDLSLGVSDGPCPYVDDLNH